ncbi:MAG: O-Antigen polymerase family [bacterium P3]|nr:MAG: O-Antigen polymerase family [bacterium P3]
MNRATVHSKIYLSLLGLLVASMTTSAFFANLAWVLLLANWVLEGGWSEKWRRMRDGWLLQAFMVLMAAHLLWLACSEHLGLGLDDIRQKLPLLCIPLVVLTSRQLTQRQLGCLAAVYLTSVTTVTCIGLVRFLTIDDLPYRSIVPYISHIRFGLNVCFSICLTIYLTVSLHRRMPPSRWRLVLLSAVLLVAWYLFFLLLLQSYTSFLILLLLLCLWPVLVRFRRGWTRRLAWLVTALMLTAGVLTALRLVDDYYGTCLRDTDMVENGSYIYRDVDSVSMAAGWHVVSDAGLDAATPNGYSVYSTLVRYLNASHRSKDSAGVVSLSLADVTAVGEGVANPVYLRHPSLRKMAYMLLFEYENYRCGGAKDFSLLERLVLWRNAWHVFRQHPLSGVGTGDVAAVCRQQLQSAGVPVDISKSPHNQYLIFLVAFGLTGFLLITFFFIRALVRTPSLRSPLALAYTLIVLASFVGENTLGTLAGCLFAACPCVLLVQLPTDTVLPQPDVSIGTQTP